MFFRSLLRACIINLLLSVCALAQTEPTLTTLSSSTAVQGSSVNLTMTGSGFVQGSTTVLISGTGVVAAGVRVNSSTSLSTLLLLSGAPGTREIRVKTSSGTTAPVPFTITPSPLVTGSKFETSTVFGTKGGIGSTDGIGKEARFYLPTGVWADSTDLYVADSGNATIRRINLTTAQVTTIAGSPQAYGDADGIGSAARFVFPFGAWGGGGYLYVSDFAARTIRRIDLNTNAVTTFAGLPKAGKGVQFVGPGNMWGDGTNLYVVDSSYSSRVILKIVIASGDVSTFADLDPTTADASLVVGIWGDGTDLWIADAAQHRVKRINIASRGVTQVFGTGYPGFSSSASNVVYNAPAAVRVSNFVAGGNVLGITLTVLDSGNHSLRSTTFQNPIGSFQPDPRTTSTGSGIPGYSDGRDNSASLFYPLGMWGSYISDSFNHTIRRSGNPLLTLTTFAGAPSEWGNTDGDGTAAKLYAPFNIWGDGESLYVADTGNESLRKAAVTAGKVSTLAKQVGVPITINGTTAGVSENFAVGGDENNVYVSEIRNAIRKLGVPDGALTPLAGDLANPPGYVDDVATNARFHLPIGVWSDGTSLYVADSLNYVIRKVDIASGNTSTLAGLGKAQGTTDGIGNKARFVAPIDVWGDGEYLYVADLIAIRRVDLSTAEVTTIAGSKTTHGYKDGNGANALFGTIYGIWGDGTYLYVADGFNHVVRRVFLENGSVDTFAGGLIGTENGSAQLAKFVAPTGVWGDGTSLYVSDYGANNIRHISVVPDTTSTTTNTDLAFSINERGGLTRVTAGSALTTTAGFGRIQTAAGSSTASGMAIFGFRKEGVLVTEAAVPASPLIRSGRIYTEIRTGINTGVAFANPNAQAVSVTFFFTDSSGASSNGGTLSIPANGQIAAFLDESPFNAPKTNAGELRTFTFNASLPISVIALRGRLNERTDFLITTLPIAPIRPPIADPVNPLYSGDTTTSPVATTAISTTPVIFPHFADGDGWTTQVVLVNPTDDPLSGDIQFFSGGSRDASGQPILVTANGRTASTFPYSIAPRSAFSLVTAGASQSTQVGSVRVTPTPQTSAPTGLAVFSLKSDDVTVTEAGVAALSTGSAFRIYVEAEGDFSNKAPGSIQSGFAIANSSKESTTVNFELTTLDGTVLVSNGTATVPGNGQVAMFLNEIPGFDKLPKSLQAVLRVSGSNLSVVGLRGRYNERKEFLITTTTPADEGDPPTTSEFLFPHLLDGGGYTTQIILFNGRVRPSAGGVVRFFDQKGQILDLKLR